MRLLNEIASWYVMDSGPLSGRPLSPKSRDIHPDKSYDHISMTGYHAAINSINIS